MTKERRQEIRTWLNIGSYFSREFAQEIFEAYEEEARKTEVKFGVNWHRDE